MTDKEKIKEIIFKTCKDYRLQHKSGEYYETDILYDDLVQEIEILLNEQYKPKWLETLLKESEKEILNKIEKEFPIWKMTNPKGLTEKEKGWNDAVDYANAKIEHIFSNNLEGC